MRAHTYLVWIAGRQATPLAPPMVETPPGGHLLQSQVQKVPGLLIKLFYLWMEFYQTTLKPSLHAKNQFQKVSSKLLGQFLKYLETRQVDIHLLLLGWKWPLLKSSFPDLSHKLIVWILWCCNKRWKTDDIFWKPESSTRCAFSHVYQDEDKWKCQGKILFFIEYCWSTDILKVFKRS